MCFVLFGTHQLVLRDYSWPPKLLLAGSDYQGCSGRTWVGLMQGKSFHLSNVSGPNFPSAAMVGLVQPGSSSEIGFPERETEVRLSILGFMDCLSCQLKVIFFLAKKLSGIWGISLKS